MVDVRSISVPINLWIDFNSYECIYLFWALWWVPKRCRSSGFEGSWVLPFLNFPSETQRQNTGTQHHQYCISHRCICHILTLQFASLGNTETLRNGTRHSRELVESSKACDIFVVLRVLIFTHVSRFSDSTRDGDSSCSGYHVMLSYFSNHVSLLSSDSVVRQLCRVVFSRIVRGVLSLTVY